MRSEFPSAIGMTGMACNTDGYVLAPSVKFVNHLFGGTPEMSEAMIGVSEASTKSKLSETLREEPSRGSAFQMSPAGSKDSRI